jgi:dihydroorotase
VAPHHLLFSTADYERLGPLVKMNPPLRSPEEVEALSRLFAQGAIEVFATDHAPHTLAEKYADVAHSPSGVPGVELYYQLLIACSKRFGLPLERAVAMATSAPAKLLGWKHKGHLAPGNDADFVIVGDEEHTILTQDVVSKCGWTPYAGWRVPRDVLATWNRGRQVYCRANHETGVP